MSPSVGVSTVTGLPQKRTDGLSLAALADMGYTVDMSKATAWGSPRPPDPNNRAPTAVGSIAAQTIVAGESVTVNVAGNFSDPDGNTLSFAAASSDAAVATASVSGSSVTINGVSAGSATVTVTATDPGGLSANPEHQRDGGGRQLS